MSLLVGCGGHDEVDRPLGPPASNLRVGLIEWEVTSSAERLVVGPVTLLVTNAGSTAHNLRAQSDAVDVVTPVLRPGEKAELAFDAKANAVVRVTCTLPGHAAEGMQRTYRVVGG